MWMYNYDGWGKSVYGMVGVIVIVNIVVEGRAVLRSAYLDGNTWHQRYLAMMLEYWTVTGCRWLTSIQ